MKTAVSTSTAVFAISPSGQSAASYALAACREPSGIPPARVIDRRRVAAGGLAADDPASRIVVRRRRAAAVGRRAADDIAARVVEGALLRRGCVGHHRERQQCEQDQIQVTGFVMIIRAFFWANSYANVGKRSSSPPVKRSSNT